MTIYHHNPPEPLAIPTQPAPDIRRVNTANGPVADSVTRGMCGNCPCVPKLWRMDIPIDVGNPYAQYYAGTVYLAKMPNEYLSAPDLEFGDFFQDKCSWAQYLAPPIPGANRYLGPWADQGEVGRGWHLTFEGGRWWIYSPAETGDLMLEPNAQSRWRLVGHFRCLYANTFFIHDAVRAYAFPYAPEFLTITPFYA